MSRLYELALSEGEGLGTAYEYYVKLRLLNRYLDGKQIRTALIYGLPEKYGYSLDFFYFCKQKNIIPDLFEKRKSKISELQKIRSDKFNLISKICKSYDLTLSCEVLQALNESEKNIIFEDLRKYGKNIIIFVPNKSNKGHHNISGLNGFTLKGLRKMLPNAMRFGYIDMPPFPPGIRKKKKIKNKIFINLLEKYSNLEAIFPRKLKKKFSHMIYAIKE